jgi:hypothetical protein
MWLCSVDGSGVMARMGRRHRTGRRRCRGRRGRRRAMRKPSRPLDVGRRVESADVDVTHSPQRRRPGGGGRRRWGRTGPSHGDKLQLLQLAHRDQVVERLVHGAQRDARHHGAGGQVERLGRRMGDSLWCSSRNSTWRCGVTLSPMARKAVESSCGAAHDRTVFATIAGSQFVRIGPGTRRRMAHRQRPFSAEPLLRCPPMSAPTADDRAHDSIVTRCSAASRPSSSTCW